jgi:hypothetical protein
MTTAKNDSQRPDMHDQCDQRTRVRKENASLPQLGLGSIPCPLLARIDNSSTERRMTEKKGKEFVHGW